MDTVNYDVIQAGWTAHGRDGDKIGDIEEVDRDYLLVTKGLIFTTDLYVPASAVEQVDANERRVYLTVAKDEVESRGWTAPPAPASRASTEADAAMAAGATGAAMGRESELAEGEELRVPLREERLRTEKTTERAGEVRVGKSVREEQETLDVPVTHDEVEIRRVATDRPVTGDDAAIAEGDTIRVPLKAERVDVSKEERVAEELEISRRQVTDTQRVSETVRREEADIEQSGDVLTTAGAATTGMGSDLDEPTATGMRGTDADLHESDALDAEDDDDMRR